MPKRKTLHVHLVSDSTGDTVHRVAQACLTQFETIDAQEHVWSLVRGSAQIDAVMRGVAEFPGVVIATFADAKLGEMLKSACEKSKTIYVPVLDPIFKALSQHIGVKSAATPGKQHELTEQYFNRIDAMDFAMHHDDGQMAEQLIQAEVILVGVSRTSKTPTCIYLSHRGLRAANVPIVPNRPLPDELFSIKGPLIIGLTNDPARLVQVRESRVQMMGAHPFQSGNAYIDPDEVRAEIRAANRLFADNGWPVIDVTRKSVEETAAIILQLYYNHKNAATG